MKISIIIATYNRCSDLGLCLESLLAQEAKEKFVFEIIVSDNNSNDDTKKTIDSYTLKFLPGTVRYIFEQRQGKSYALNTAIAQAQGDILVFIDDDVLVAKDWLEKIGSFIGSNDFDAACGRVLPQYPSDIPEWVKDNADILSGPVVSYDYGLEIKPYNQQAMHPLIGANMIVKRELFAEAGLFNTDLGPGTGTFGDDTEICLRWEKKNKKLYYAGTVLAWHPVVKERISLKYLAYWNMASGKYQTVKEKGRLNDNIICYGGVPRYLIRRIITHALKLAVYIFNKREFLRHWACLFQETGAAQAYRQYYLLMRKRP